MATTFRIGNGRGTSYYNFLTGVLKLRDGSWATRTPSVEGKYDHTRWGAQPRFSHLGVQTENLELVGQDTVSNLIGAVNEIEEQLEAARDWHEDRMRKVSRWLEANADGESARRSLIYEGSVRYPTGIGISPLLERGTMRARVSISRHPLWEDMTGRTITLTNLSTLGGSAAIEDVVGVYPSRMSLCQVKGRNGGGGPIYRGWIGIRPAYEGTNSPQVMWEAESGGVYSSNDTSKVADAACSGGYKVQTTFATHPEMCVRAHGWGGDVPDDMGRYLVLGRCKVTESDTVVGVRMHIGYINDGMDAPTGDEVWITNTAWRLIPLTVFQMPPHPYRWDNYDRLKSNRAFLYAERAAGTGYFELDALVYIPANHFAYFEGGRIQYNVEGYCPLDIYTFEDDTTGAVGTLSTAGGEFDSLAVSYSTTDFYLPVGDSTLVFAGERETQHVLDDAVDVTIKAWSRWPSYRGA